jgi:hypothetical protein
MDSTSSFVTVNLNSKQLACLDPVFKTIPHGLVSAMMSS